jgi:hypothetical protein
MEYGFYRIIYLLLTHEYRNFPNEQAYCFIILAYQCCFRELIQAQKQHKEKLKVFLKGDIPLEDTEIGRIDRKLRMVMSRRHLMKKKNKLKD